MKHTYRRGRRGRYTAPKRNRMNSAVVGIVGTIAALGIIGACSDEAPADEGMTVTILETGHDGADDGRQVMTQGDFPCNEDEVLAYDPSFGPNHVGCINREDVD